MALNQLVVSLYLLSFLPLSPMPRAFRFAVVEFHYKVCKIKLSTLVDNLNNSEKSNHTITSSNIFIEAFHDAISTVK